MQEFEKHPELTNVISKIANYGYSNELWSSLLNEVNNSLKERHQVQDLAERLFIQWNPLQDNQKCYDEFAKRSLEAAKVFYVEVGKVNPYDAFWFLSNREIYDQCVKRGLVESSKFFYDMDNRDSRKYMLDLLENTTRLKTL